MVYMAGNRTHSAGGKKLRCSRITVECKEKERKRL